MSLRVGIVGCGKIADGHVDEIRKIPGADVSAVCDLEPIMSEQMALRFGVPRHYSNYGEMLDREKLDVVHICTPPHSHPALAIQAMDRGCHVLVEKPFAIDYAGAKRIVDHARMTNRRLCTNYWYNFDPPGLALAELYASGALGEAVHLESFFGYGLSGDFGTALFGDPNHWVHQLPGKLFHNVLDHIVNKLTLYLPDPEPVVLVDAFRRRPATGDPVNDGILDELRFVVRGEKVTGYGTFSGHVSPIGQSLRFYGTRNTVHVDYRIRSVTIEADQAIPSALGRLFPPWIQGWRQFREGGRNLMQFIRSEAHFFAGMQTLFRRFYSSIEAGTPEPIAASEILRIAWIMDRIIEQLPAGAQQHSRLVETSR